MSKSGILAALRFGPKTTAELLLVTGMSPADISRDCAGLRHAGKVKRVDGALGRGTKAIYALALPGELPVAPPPPRRRPAATATTPAHTPKAAPPETIVDRDPCFMCGVRGDVGCVHRRRAA